MKGILGIGSRVPRTGGQALPFPRVLIAAAASVLAMAAAAVGFPVDAAVLTWDGGGATTNWSEAANWSTNVVPGAADVARFDGTSAKAAVVNANVGVGGIEIDATYGGSITQGVGRTITIGASGLLQQAASFTGSAAAITINGPLSISGGTFTSTTGSLSVGGQIDILGGTFNHGSGTLRLTGAAATIDVNATLSLWNLVLAQSNAVPKTIAAGDTLVVDGLLTLTNGTLEGGSLSARGDISQAAGFDGGLGSLRLDGAGAQLFSGAATATAGQLPPLVIDKPSGTLTLSGTLRTQRDWTYTAGTLDPGSSTVVFFGSPTITSGGVSLYDVRVAGGAPVLADALQVDGDLLISGGTLDADGWDLVIVGGLTVAGTLDATGSGVRVAGDVAVTGGLLAAGGEFTLDGSAAQSLLTSGNGMHDVTIENPAGVVLADALAIGGTLDLAGPLTIGPYELTISAPIAGTPTLLLGGPASSLVVAGIASGIRVPASIAQLLAITITNPAGAALDAPLTVTDADLAGGNLVAEPHALIIGSGGLLTRTSGHVVGVLQKPVTIGGPTTLVFEVGDGTTFAPLEVSWAAVSAAGALAVSSISGDAPAIAASPLDPAATVNRHWTIDVIGLADDPVTLVAAYASADLDATADPSFVVAAFDDGIGWTLPTVTDRGSASVEVSGLALRSGTLALGMGASDLAVSLSDAPDPAEPGQIVVYRLAVLNRGPLAAGDVRASIELPPGAEIASIDDGAATCGALLLVLTCALGTLEPGATLEIEIGVLYATPGQYAVRAIAEAGESSDPTAEANEAIAVTTVADSPGGPTPMPTPPSPDPAALLPDTAAARFAPTAAALIASAFLLASIVALGARRTRH